MSDYETRKQRLSEQMRGANDVRLDKRTSNLFRAREAVQKDRLSVRDFNHVLSIDSSEGTADVEGMTTYEDFVKETLKYGFMPAVVPQLKTITVGGAVSGVGIEATSFRYGLVHETIVEMEILLPTGETIVCNKKQNQDLFYGFPNSYGTFGYALRLKVKLIPVKPFVKIVHARYNDTASYFKGIENLCGASAHEDGTSPDFVDGTIFGPTEMYVTTGRFVVQAPFASDYTYMNIYYKSIRAKKEDYLSVQDFIWRWDTDWFWCSNAFGAQNPFIRRLLGKKRLTSAVYWKIGNFAQRHPFVAKIGNRFARRESVIQDVDIPVENAPAFAEFFFRNIGITPVWMCPIGTYDSSAKFGLYPLDPKKLYINFGFWNTVATDKEDGYYNRLIEAKVSELRGVKSLYSDSFYTREEFWKLYDKNIYDALKRKYDPQRKLKDLFEKCVEKR